MTKYVLSHSSYHGETWWAMKPSDSLFKT